MSSVADAVDESSSKFGMVPLWVLKYKLSGAELAVYVAMRSWGRSLGSDDQTIWPTQRTIAERAHVEKRTAERAISKFRSLGLFTSYRVLKVENGHVVIERCRYTLADDDPNPSPKGSTKGSSKGSAESSMGPRDTLASVSGEPTENLRPDRLPDRVSDRVSDVRPNNARTTAVHGAVQPPSTCGDAENDLSNAEQTWFRGAGGTDEFVGGGTDELVGTGTDGLAGVTTDQREQTTVNRPVPISSAFARRPTYGQAAADEDAERTEREHLWRLYKDDPDGLQEFYESLDLDYKQLVALDSMAAEGRHPKRILNAALAWDGAA